MSISSIPPKVRIELWAKAAGRCEYPGCNKPLWRDGVSMRSMNISYLAHIIADEPTGPRGDKVLSKQLRDKFDNIMLLCDQHHRLIDKENVSGHPVELLRKYKQDHEERIWTVTEKQEHVRTEIVRFSSRIQDRNALVTFEQARGALAPERYPVSEQGIRVDLSDLQLNENDSEYWSVATTAIERRLELALAGGVGPTGQPLSHLSVFALAPIPLLICFGKKLGDIYPTDVYQRHRHQENWAWQDDDDPGFNYKVLSPEPDHMEGSQVAVCLSLSGTVHISEVDQALGGSLPTYHLTISEPRRDFLRAKSQLELFLVEWSRLLAKIRGAHGPDVEIHLFPAVPNSIAVEVGRAILPKADPILVIYDHIRDSGGFKKVLSL